MTLFGKTGHNENCVVPFFHFNAFENIDNALKNILNAFQNVGNVYEQNRNTLKTI